ncbi:MAG: CPBP family glutamic-type intramembrane protease [Parcubacteria group bacterium]|jgi:hypothetical protein
MKINLSGQSNKDSFIRNNQKEIAIGFCALLAVLVRIIFPAQMNGEIFWIDIFLFFIFPWLVIRFLLKEKLNSFGISLGDKTKGIVLSAIFTAVFVLINYLIVRNPNLRGQLQISPGIVKSFWIFLWFQLVISLSAHFSSEFLFRGFIGLGMKNKLGGYAIVIQAIAQTILYARSPWLIILLIGSSSLFAGVISQKSRSIIYPFVSMWLISLSLDIMIIRYIHQGII